MNRRDFIKITVAAITIKLPYQAHANYSKKNKEAIPLKKFQLNKPEIINLLNSKSLKKSLFPTDRNSLILKVKIATDINKATLLAVSSSSFCQSYNKRDVSGIILHRIEKDKINNIFKCVINRSVADTVFFKEWQDLYLISLEKNRPYITKVKLQNLQSENGSYKIAKGNIINKAYAANVEETFKIDSSVKEIEVKLV